MTAPLQIGAEVQEVATILVDDVFEMITLFTQVAFADPFFVSFLMLAFGALLTGAASVVFGGLSVASVVGTFLRLSE